jgi:hypothetical protein
MRTTNSNNQWGNNYNPNYQGYGQRVCLRTRSTRQLLGDAAAAPPAPPPPPSPPPPFWLAGNLTTNATGNGTANGTAVAPPPFWMEVVSPPPPPSVYLGFGSSTTLRLVGGSNGSDWVYGRLEVLYNVCTTCVQRVWGTVWCVVG